MNHQKSTCAAALALLLIVSLTCGAVPKSDRPLMRIAFGSCADENAPQPIWEQISRVKPDIFVLLGDNVYADTEDMNLMRAKYAKLASVPGFGKLRENRPVVAVWDDHDYGVNDGGAEYPKRAESQRVFLDFFGEPQDSPRRTREGIYDAKIYGPPGKRVQLILLDTRYFRSPLKKKDSNDTGDGRYVPQTDPSTTMLGAAQWKWLEEQLRAPAEVRIIASSIQVVPEEHRWEKWMNFPHERQKLFNLVRDTRAGGVIFISGDRHFAELSMMDAGLGYPLYDLTSSGLNRGWKAWRYLTETNRHRLGAMSWGDNFGLITVDWDRADPLISLQVRDDAGDINIQRKISLSTIQFVK